MRAVACVCLEMGLQIRTYHNESKSEISRTTAIYSCVHKLNPWVGPSKRGAKEFSTMHAFVRALKAAGLLDDDDDDDDGAFSNWMHRFG
jgi:hypothetical protein